MVTNENIIKYFDDIPFIKLSLFNYMFFLTVY